MKNNKIRQFEISDFYQAAYLSVIGFELIKIDKANPQRFVFVFNDKEGRQNLLEDFLFGRAQVNPKSFVSAIKELKAMLHSGL